MSMPFAHDDIAKLQTFIEFVSANPTILNLPQLNFVKKFIESFDGKVPTGAFQMPEGGKCPFGGDAKADPPPATAQPQDPKSDLEDADMESEESEVELDMEVDINTLRNTIYLQPHVSVVEKGDRAANSKQILDPFLDNSEYSYGVRNFALCAEDVEDPINTVERDNDIDDEQIITWRLNIASDAGAASAESESESESRNGIDPIDSGSEQNINSSSLRRGRSAQDDNKIGLSAAQCKGGSKQQKRPKPINCAENCKQKCTEKIDNATRQQLCRDFWQMPYVERKNYILGCVESMKILRVRAHRSNRTARCYTNRYFLVNRKGARIRVCLQFFQTTLNISGCVIRNAVQESDGNGHYMGQDKRGDHRRKMGHKEYLNTRLDSKEVEMVPNHESVDVDTRLWNTVEREALNVAVERDTKQNTKEVTGKASAPRKTNKGKTLKRDRLPRPVHCEKGCQMQCTSHFSEEQRCQICATFWSMDYKRRKDFVLSRIESREVNSVTTKEFRKSTRAVRTFSNRYFFRGVRGENVRVCLNFFLATLCIGRPVIDNALRNADRQTGSYTGEDMRGKHAPTNKIPEHMLDAVKRHIESYPTWVPHKNYRTRFLHSSLNIRKMYREYKECCIEQQRRYVGHCYFGNVFHKHFRLAFLKPTSKHTHKVSPQKANAFAATAVETTATATKSSNPNISDFTGEEGGFWLHPKREDSTSSAARAPASFEVRPIVSTERVHVQGMELNAAAALPHIKSNALGTYLPQNLRNCNLSNVDGFDEQSSADFRLL